MQLLKKILVVADPFATEHPCFQKAAVLAKASGARLELLFCDTKATQAKRAAALLNKPNNLAMALEEQLEALAAPLRKSGVEVTTTVLFAEPLHSAILQHVRHCNADLVVKDTHHHSAIKRTFLTNTDWHLIRGCLVPLLLTKAKPWQASPHILAALDPGHAHDKPASLDERLLYWAGYVAKTLHGTAHAAHAFIPAALIAMTAGGGPPTWIPTVDEVIQSEMAEKRAELTALVKGFAVELKNVHLELGSPGDVLQHVIERIDADLLVTGAVSRSGLERVFLGSTAERILEQIPCDLLVVKPANFTGEPSN